MILLGYTSPVGVDFMICTFIGHRDTPNEIEAVLEEVLIELIEEKGVKNFYVGTHGNFDYMVLKALKRLSGTYPQIVYKRVLAYIPKNRDDYTDYSDSIYPDGLESTPPKFSIIKRNRWMLERADLVVCYVTQNMTNAGEFMKLAKRRGKTVINIAQVF